MSTPMEAYVMFRWPHFLCGKGRLGEAASQSDQPVQCAQGDSNSHPA